MKMAQSIQDVNKNVLKYLRERKFYTTEDNIISAEKAFVAASIVRHFIKEKSEGKLNDKQVNAYLKALVEYQQGIIELMWQGGLIKFKKLGEQANATTQT